METDHRPTPENPDQGTSDEQAASPVRSYDCTFCKRGFSNAQALGGHMNIHRKEKAKLKQSAASSKNSNRQSLDIPKIPTSYSSIPTNIIRPSVEVIKKAIQKTSTAKWPWFLVDEENDATESDKTQFGDVRQLPLFVERQIWSIDQNPGSQVHRSSTEKDLSSSSSELELDLELRLGPEPRDSTSASGTKRGCHGW